MEVNLPQARIHLISAVVSSNPAGAGVVADVAVSDATDEVVTGAGAGLGGARARDAGGERPATALQTYTSNPTLSNLTHSPNKRAFRSQISSEEYTKLNLKVG